MLGSRFRFRVSGKSLEQGSGTYGTYGQKPFSKGSVNFTADFLATDRLELLCCQPDAIRMKRSVYHAISVLLIV